MEGAERNPSPGVDFVREERMHLSRRQMQQLRLSCLSRRRGKNSTREREYIRTPNHDPLETALSNKPNASSQERESKWISREKTSFPSQSCFRSRRFITHFSLPAQETHSFMSFVIAFVHSFFFLSFLSHRHRQSSLFFFNFYTHHTKWMQEVSLLMRFSVFSVVSVKKESSLSFSSVVFLSLFSSHCQSVSASSFLWTPSRPLFFLLFSTLLLDFLFWLSLWESILHPMSQCFLHRKEEENISFFSFPGENYRRKSLKPPEESLSLFSHFSAGYKKSNWWAMRIKKTVTHDNNDDKERKQRLSSLQESQQKRDTWSPTRHWLLSMTDAGDSLSSLVSFLGDKNHTWKEEETICSTSSLCLWHNFS